jgi:hypothetical protein
MIRTESQAIEIKPVNPWRGERKNREAKNEG